MTAEDVVNFYSKLEEQGVETWIDGGWGIDALIGEQTRLHTDLDIVIQEKDTPKAKELLRSQGYEILKRDDSTYNYFHMADDQGHEIDVTAIHFDQKGDGIFGDSKNNEMNPRDSFKGEGKIGDHKVKCVSMEYAISFRMDHEIAEHDAEDIRSLCKKFDLEIPSIYKN